jgi:alpha-L-rhamnosidase
MITNLLCEYRSNPLGIDITKPRLSWQMQTERQGARQTAYRILAGSSEGGADLWDSGKVESDQSVHIVYDGKPLTSRQRVYWKVIVWDETGSENQSDSAWFELGLLNREDWQAEWIGASLAGGPRTTIPAPFLRKSFSLSNSVKCARLYVTALGLYECSINGQVVHEDVLSPGWTEFRKRVRYNVYDVTRFLQSGDNVLGAVLGDGWAVGHISWQHRQQYFDRPRLLAQLELTMDDGSTTVITSDSSWKYGFGPLLENDLLMGEAYDARLEIPGWNKPHFDDTNWLNAQIFDDPGIAIVATNGPNVRRFEELKPISAPVDKSSFFSPQSIYDLGQNMVGRVRFKGSAPKGTTITLRFAEVLNPDGSLYTANLRTARVTDYYTFKGEGEEVWEPKFTFHGFRYVELSGYPGEATTDTITGIVLHSDMPRSGEFECSDPLLNQLQSNILWGQKGNFVDVPTDCPQRDERLGWTGDIQVFVRTAAFNMDVAGFMTKWSRDVEDAQGEEGAIPAVVPNIVGLMSDGGPAWADAVIICPWTIYLCYGDKRILEENYEAMTRFINFLLDTSPGYIRCAPDYPGWQGFGDWLSINADTPRDLIGTAFLAYDAQLMKEIADVLGKEDDCLKYQALCEDVKQAFATRYLAGSEVRAPEGVGVRSLEAGTDAISRGTLKAVDYGPITSEVFNTNLFTPNQTAYVLALHFDLLPANLRPLAAAELVKDIERRDMHLSTGFVGAPYLPHVLSSNGELETAYRLLNQKTWPSWLYSVTQGATTVWERWDGWTEENGFQSPQMNSFNHYAYGSIGEWLYNTVAGIELDSDKPGYKHSILRPMPDSMLTYAKGKLKTLYGDLLSHWQMDNGSFNWEIVVPPNTTATAYLPMEGTATLNGERVSGSVHELTAGKYQFSVKAL